MQQAVSEAAGREVARRGLGADVGEVVQETTERLAPIVEIPRSPSGEPRPTLLEPQRRLGVEEQPVSILDSLRRQEVMFKEDRDASGLLAKALSSETPEGMIVESYPAYIGRLLGVVPEVIVGGIEAAATDKTFTEAVSKRIQEGRGFMGGAYDLGEALVDAAGIENEALRTIIPMRMGALGLGLDLIFPIDAGVTGAVSRVRQTAKAAKAAKGATGAVEKALVESVPPIYKPELGTSIAKNAVIRFATNQDNIDNAVKLLSQTTRSAPGKELTKNAVDLGLGYKVGSGKTTKIELYSEIQDAASSFSICSFAAPSIISIS